MRTRGAYAGKRVETYRDRRIWAVDRALRRIREDLTGTHSLDELSHSACLSPFHFHRVFRQITLTTPARFLAAIRLAEAKRLLVTTHLNVTTICMQVGYSSLGTFTSQFTRHVGVSPRRFRLLVADVADQPYVGALAAAAASAPADSADHLLRIRLNGLETGKLALVGLFETGIPQGWPAACSLARESSTVTMSVDAAGTYTALAMSFSPDVDVGTAMSNEGESPCLVGSCGPLQIRHGRQVTVEVQLDLRPRRSTDPPILFASPLLAAQRRAISSIPTPREEDRTNVVGRLDVVSPPTRT